MHHIRSSPGDNPSEQQFKVPTLMKTTIYFLILVIATVAEPLQADIITPVPIDHLLNQNLRGFTDGGSYPVAPTTLTVGGVDFNLVSVPNISNSLGIYLPDSNTMTSIPVNNIFGATTGYTLINSVFGGEGLINGRIEFIGTNSAFASFDLLQGFNIRDHRQGNYNNLVTDPTIVTAQFGNARLDRQTFNLPTIFATEYLTEIRLVTNNNSGTQGYPFVAAITVQSVPEPSSLLFTLAVCGLAVMRRRCR
jgi:hypothetical protein